jgi:hypothetical protein
MSTEDAPDDAIEHLRQQIAFARETGATSPSALNAVAGRNVLHEDLGRFSSRLPHYRLNEDTRDRLIAHARQDAAHALLNTATLLDSVRNLRRMVALLAILLTLILLGIGAPLFLILASQSR